LQKIRLPNHPAIRAPKEQLVRQQLRKEVLRRATAFLFQHCDLLIERDQISFQKHNPFTSSGAIEQRKLPHDQIDFW
jgi:hypothetical protein